MKERYLDIMERVVNVYTPERFDNYIHSVRESGIREHGFPRLCANIGILMAHGRLLHLRPRFEEMIELCCRDIPYCNGIKGKRGNDFSVREVLSAILELEQAKLFPAQDIARWKSAIAAVDPHSCYRMIAPVPPVAVDNWGAFNAASEQLRCKAGLANTHDYIENQIASQMFSFDENGMYRDPNDPIVYDLVTRNMLSTCLYYGYSGKHAAKLNEHLRKAGDLTLLMQSVTGELGYGGRSNQFLHNEAHLTVCFEYEANARKQSDPQKAGQFKAAAALALRNIEHWLDNAPGQHIKNYFPNDSGIGCESYAYYDKYMVTIASFLYLAYNFCDDSIAPTVCPAETGCHSFQTSAAFRKLFCKAGSYFTQLEWNSDNHYDAAGIGRLHRRGAPSALCLSVPVSQAPNYGIVGSNETALSICCGKIINGNWHFAFDENARFTLLQHTAANDRVDVRLQCTLDSADPLTQQLTLTDNGLDIRLQGIGQLGLLLPAFHFDGAEYTSVSSNRNSLSIVYKGWQCRYQTNGTISEHGLRATNRNGVYNTFRAEGTDILHVHISLEPIF